MLRDLLKTKGRDVLFHALEEERVNGGVVGDHEPRHAMRRFHVGGFLTQRHL